MSDQPVVSVIIVSYQVSDLLRDCLLSVEGELRDLPAEVWVVDNASDDGSADMVAAEFPWVKLIQNATNRGFAAANNQALREAAGRFVLLLNPDTIVQDGAITQLIEFLETHPEAGVVGPHVVGVEGYPQRSFWPFPSLRNTLLVLSGLYRWPPIRLRLHRYWDVQGTRPVDWISGVCMLVRRTAIEHVGFLDEQFFMYGEDVDWCRRFADAGWAIWFLADAQIIHYGGQSTVRWNLTAESDLWSLQTGRNDYFYARKHWRTLEALLLRASYLIISLAGWIRWRLLAPKSGNEDSQYLARLYRQRIQDVWRL